MSGRLVVQSTDYHTAGEPFRIVNGGVGSIPGATMLEKRRYAMQHLDYVRQLLVNEPRGHHDMYGCFVTDAVSADADLGVLFFHNAGFSTACGHGTIALVTAALENGWLPRFCGVDPWPDRCRVVVDAPSGRLETLARMAPNGRVASVAFRNVPAYVETARLSIAAADLPRVEVAIAYGGAFYALVEARDVDLCVEPDMLPRLITAGRAIKAAVEAVHMPAHPIDTDITGIYGVIFADHIGSSTLAASQHEARHDVNVTVFADGEVDRSPCGSGTSARLAWLYATGQIALSQPLIHDSIIGSRFNAYVVARTEVAGMPAALTEVAGSASLTGYHTFILEPDDPLGTGFLLRH